MTRQSVEQARLLELMNMVQRTLYELVEFREETKRELRRLDERITRLEQLAASLSEGPRN